MAPPAAPMVSTHSTLNRVRPLEPVPPAWVRCVAGRTRETALVSRTIAGASALTSAALAAAVRDTYRAIASELATRSLHAVRFWNFIPGIGAAMGEGLDRYMVFNRGRHEACLAWFGTIDHQLPTASAVGYEGADLVVYCLAAVRPGVPVENPRQIPAWRYSSRFGPRPPCFARATIAELDDAHVLLIGGTASIVGETSVHEDDVRRQTAESLRNLAVLVETAEGPSGHSGCALDRLRSVRVYVRRPEDGPVIAKLVAPLGPDAELVTADICRPELLVEIEAVMPLDGAPSTAERPRA